MGAADSWTRRIQGLGRLPSGTAEPGHSDCLSQLLAVPGRRLRSPTLTTLACWAQKGPREELVRPRLASVSMLWAGPVLLHPREGSCPSALSEERGVVRAGPGQPQSGWAGSVSVHMCKWGGARWGGGECWSQWSQPHAPCLSALTWGSLIRVPNPS